MDSHRPGVTNFVHVGLVVEDLDQTVRFLALLGNGRGDRRLREHVPPLLRPRTEGLIVELAERLDGAPG
jgi:hypothetical protein